jgi:tRNA threonylcarbamoyladenosine biosynthesis protein TsaB
VLVPPTVVSSLIVPMIDARRMEVYSAIFRPNLENRETQAEIISEDSFLGLNENIYFG